MANLTSLVHFEIIDMYSFTGDFPQEFFQLVNLTTISVEGSLNMKWPASAIAPLTEMFVSVAKKILNLSD